MSNVEGTKSGVEPTKPAATAYLDWLKDPDGWRDEERKKKEKWAKREDDLGATSKKVMGRLISRDANYHEHTQASKFKNLVELKIVVAQI